MPPASDHIVPIIVLTIIIISILIFEVYLFRTKRYAVAIGGLVGFVLAIANFFAVGFIGFVFWLPFEKLCRGGEHCWGEAILGGSIGLLLAGYIIGWAVSKIRSYRKKKE